MPRRQHPQRPPFPPARLARQDRAVRAVRPRGLRPIPPAWQPRPERRGQAIFQALLSCPAAPPAPARRMRMPRRVAWPRLTSRRPSRRRSRPTSGRSVRLGTAGSRPWIARSRARRPARRCHSPAPCLPPGAPPRALPWALPRAAATASENPGSVRAMGGCRPCARTAARPPNTAGPVRSTRASAGAGCRWNQGSTFPGFMMPSGSRACLIERISASSTGDL